VVVLAILVTLIGGSLCVYAAGGWFAWQFHRRTAPSGSSFQPPVSILVPVSGFDDTTWECLTALCRQDYADYEVLIGTTDPRDPAAGPLRRLAAAYPERVRLFLGLPPVAPITRTAS